MLGVALVILPPSPRLYYLLNGSSNGRMAPLRLSQGPSLQNTVRLPCLLSSFSNARTALLSRFILRALGLSEARPSSPSKEWFERSARRALASKF